MDKHKRDMIIRLYRFMPGAPQVPFDEAGNVLWGEVENTEHWAFAEALASEIISTAQAYSK